MLQPGILEICLHEYIIKVPHLRSGFQNYMEYHIPFRRMWCLLLCSSNSRSAKRNLFTTPFLFLLRIFENFAFDKSQKNDKQSVISGHVLTYELKINFNDFIILSKDSNNFNLLIKESLLTAHDKPSLKKNLAQIFPIRVIWIGEFLLLYVLITLFNKNV